MNIHKKKCEVDFSSPILRVVYGKAEITTKEDLKFKFKFWYMSWPQQHDVIYLKDFWCLHEIRECIGFVNYIGKY